MPDPNYWWRGMYSGGQAGATKEFKREALQFCVSYLHTALTFLLFMDKPCRQV